MDIQEKDWQIQKCQTEINVKDDAIRKMTSRISELNIKIGYLMQKHHSKHRISEEEMRKKQF